VITALALRARSGGAFSPPRLRVALSHAEADNQARCNEELDVITNPNRHGGAPFALLRYPAIKDAIKLQPDAPRFSRACRAAVPKLNPPCHHFVQRIFEKHAFEPIPGVPWRLFTGSCPRLIDVALRAQNLQWEILEQVCGTFESQVNRVVGKRPDFVRHANRPPARMQSGSYGVHGVMNVYGEIEQPAEGKHSGELFHNLLRRSA
jgi:hypothetical protein